MKILTTSVLALFLIVVLATLSAFVWQIYYLVPLLVLASIIPFWVLFKFLFSSNDLRKRLEKYQVSTLPFPVCVSLSSEDGRVESYWSADESNFFYLNNPKEEKALAFTIFDDPANRLVLVYIQLEDRWYAYKKA